jgi:hypothetical protein
MYTGSCHCGAVRMTLPFKPEVATACNCSLCRRIGGPWVYFEFGTVRIEGHPEATAEYIQGDKTLPLFAAEPVGASRTGSRCRQLLARGMESTSRTSIRNSSHQCECGDSTERIRGNLSTNSSNSCESNWPKSAITRRESNYRI